MNDASPSESLPPFRTLVERHKKRVYYLALDLTGNHHDAEDLSQEVFIKAHRSLDSFRGDASFFSWLYRIAVNTYLNKSRKKAVSEMTLWDNFEHITQGAGAPSGPDTKAERSTMQAHIEASLEALSERERSAFVLQALPRVQDPRNRRYARRSRGDYQEPSVPRHPQAPRRARLLPR